MTRHFVAIESPPQPLAISTFVRERRRALVGISRLHHQGVFAAQRAHRHTYARTRSHAAYVLQVRWTKLWPVSIGRALRVVYRSTFWSCNTRPDTDRRDCAAAATHGEPVDPGIVQANVVHALRNCRQADRPFVSNGEKPVNFVGIKSIKVR